MVSTCWLSISRKRRRNELDIREQVIYILKQIGPNAKAAIPALKKVATSDSDEFVRNAAKEAIENISQ
ncbi:MAG: hypothetical protein GPJ52_00935 [Candidatus Heimdallarchaeota archaeon]|nr:hypothetical protein [Candidatus Heimdallarchaeota archaeon]